MAQRPNNYNDNNLTSEGMKMENAIPTDSVLRRHYEATHGHSMNNNSQNQSTQSSGGFMCWLKKLFGG